MPSSDRKRVRAFLQAPSIHQDPPENELLARRWESARTRDLRVSDLRALLRSEREARRALRELQRRRAAAISTLSRRARDASAQHNEMSVLREENATLRNTVAELRAEKDRANQELAALRKGTPPPFVSETDLRKVAEDLLPKFLDILYKAGK
jgi:seryl-tRNA synthetase